MRKQLSPIKCGGKKRRWRCRSDNMTRKVTMYCLLLDLCHILFGELIESSTITSPTLLSPVSLYTSVDHKGNGIIRWWFLWKPQSSQWQCHSLKLDSSQREGNKKKILIIIKSDNEETNRWEIEHLYLLNIATTITA